MRFSRKVHGEVQVCPVDNLIAAPGGSVWMAKSWLVPRVIVAQAESEAAQSSTPASRSCLFKDIPPQEGGENLLPSGRPPRPPPVVLKTGIAARASKISI